LLMLSGILSMPVSAQENDVFYEDFSGAYLDSDKWLIAYKNWGGQVDGTDYNGGVIPENVRLEDGKLILTGYGNQYTGDVKGINRDKSERETGQRVGAAIATKDYFASGSYEISAKISPELGVCSAMWTFEYEEDYSNDDLKITNHEIDIEFPGRDENNDYSLSHALCTTWIGENDGEYLSNSVDIGQNMADGAFHKYRFDWHTGDEQQEKRVDFYFDDVLVYTSHEFVPTNAGRLWLGLWFPRYWAGTPDFDTTTFEIDYLRITPFHEAGDTPQNESYPDSGWAVPAERIPGDVNHDSVFNTVDIVNLQRFLLNDGTRLPDWKAADLSGDGMLNIYDLILMKRRILHERD